MDESKTAKEAVLQMLNILSDIGKAFDTGGAKEPKIRINENGICFELSKISPEELDACLGRPASSQRPTIDFKLIKEQLAICVGRYPSVRIGETDSSISVEYLPDIL